MSSTQPPPHPARQRWGRLAIGLTGGIGSGKSTVAKLFAQRGASIIDTDSIAHALTAPGGAAISSIASEFGEEFIQADGALNRPRMREKVFADAAQKQRLEAILHPMIGLHCVQQAQQASGKYLIFDVPLLTESRHWQQNVERILVVDCPQELQISRVIARSNLSENQVRAIIANQASRERRLALADDVIDNQGRPEQLEVQINHLHDLYLKLL